MKIKPVKRAVAVHVTKDGNVLCNTSAHYVNIETGQSEPEVWFPCGGWWPLAEFHVYTWEEVLNYLIDSKAQERDSAEAIQAQLTSAQAARAEKLGYVLVMITSTVTPIGTRIPVLTI